MPIRDDPEIVPQHDDIEGVTPPSATLRLFGREREWRNLTDSERSGRMHHAWLLQGSQGIGKATLAFFLARHVLGFSPKIDQNGSTSTLVSPDNPLVRQIAHGSHPNVIHISRPAADRGGFKTQITVDEIRRLAQFFQRTAGRDWRVAIIDPADDLNRNASNALLKILEEPPARSVFLVISHSPGRLLPTIRSRCRLLRFDDLTTAQVTGVISHLRPERAGDAAAAAARADGSMRTALLLLEEEALGLFDQLDSLLSAQRATRERLYAMAESMTQKGREGTFELLSTHLFRALSREASERVRAGQGKGAERFAAFWQSESRRWQDAVAFNLDRKQMLISLFERLAEERAAA